MRAGGMYHRIKFFAKQVTRDVYGSSIDVWDYNTPTITTKGEVRYSGGSKTISNDEKFYSKNVELLVRYRSTIVETMKVQIDGTNDIWVITYLEILGRKETLRLTIEKAGDGLTATIVLPPWALSVTDMVRIYPSDPVKVDVQWANNAANDGVLIERSVDGNSFTEVKRIDKAVIPVITWRDDTVVEETRYYYRVRAFNYSNYSAYTVVETVTTGSVT
jgi:head-tail adaptor